MKLARLLLATPSPEPAAAASGPATPPAWQAGDAGAKVPGGQAYLLKHLIHDWDDPRHRHAAELSQRMAPQARLLRIEGALPPRIDQSE